ncbi:MAG: phycobilisome rod-core linker polypeptide [Cyanobacteria bacterium J06634_5]
MTDRINGGSPVVHPQQYHTVPTAVIDGAHQRDRYLNHSELQELSGFLQTGLRRLEIAQILSQHANTIVAAGGKRIFVGGNPMDYFDPPEDPIGLPGSGYFVAEDYLSAKDRSRKENNVTVRQGAKVTLVNPIDWFKRLFFSGKPSVPSSFQAIRISDYGKVRMERSMRDLDWFLRYITYAIVAGDTSIISINTRGLRGVIPEDVTLATAVALREMQWKALSFFPAESAAAALVKQYFEVLIADYWVEKPSDRFRTGVSKHHQGLQLPESYEESGNNTPRWVMKPELSELEKDVVIRAAYRQIFERDVSQLYAPELTELVSHVKGGQGNRGSGSMEAFIRQLGKSRLYRQLYYEPYTISRSIELACRHFLGRGLSCLEEFQGYFELVAKKGFPALIDALVGSQEYADYFGVETVPYLRGLGSEAQECRNWGPQLDLFKYSAPVRKVPQFVTTFAGYQQPLPNQHPYGVGNDPLEIQFGAIFPQETKDPNAQPAHFSKDSRRILISSGGYNTSQSISQKTKQRNGRKIQSAGIKQPVNTLSSITLNRANPSSFSSTQQSVDAVILAGYRQVFGREVLESQRHSVAETQLRGGRITVREFVRQLAKSKDFRRAYWETLYMTKAAEVIHRRLLGRPTYSRRETNKYYDICGRQGFYALIDTLVDSAEYDKAFGDNTVPYERYVTPRGLSLRSPQGPVAWSKPRENPPTVGEYMMHYRPPAPVGISKSACSDLNDSEASVNNQPKAASTTHTVDDQIRQPAPLEKEPSAVQVDPEAEEKTAQEKTAQEKNQPIEAGVQA